MTLRTIKRIVINFVVIIPCALLALLAVRVYRQITGASPDGLQVVIAAVAITVPAYFLLGSKVSAIQKRIK